MDHYLGNVSILYVYCITLQVGKKLGEQWKIMSDEAKAPFLKRASEDKKRYEAECVENNYVKPPRASKGPGKGAAKASKPALASGIYTLLL